MNRTDLFPIVIVVFSIVMVYSLGVCGDTYTVDADDPDNFDVIQEAIDSAEPNSTITVKSGTYQNKVTLNKPLTLKAAGGARPVIDGTGQSGRYHVVSIASSHVTLEGFEVRGDEENHTGISIVSKRGAHTDISILDNHIHGMAGMAEGPGPWTFGILGAWGGPLGEVKIEGNEISDIGKSDSENPKGFGVALVNVSDPNGNDLGDGAIVRNNYVHHIYDGPTREPRGYFGSAINVGSISDTTDTSDVLVEGNRYSQVSNGVAIWASNSQVKEGRDDFSGVRFFVTNVGRLATISDDKLAPYVKTNRTPLFGLGTDVYFPNLVGAVSFSESGATLVASPGEFEGVVVPLDIRISSSEGAEVSALVGGMKLDHSGVVVGGRPGTGFQVDNIVLTSGDSRVNWNYITGPLKHMGSRPVNAMYNYWGTADPDWAERLPGAGPVIVSPWLGEHPWKSPTTLVVGDVRNEPPDGYLNTAISTSNELEGEQIILIRGSNDPYTLSKAIKGPLTMLSEPGSPQKTLLEGELVLSSSDIRVGRWREGEDNRGFTIEDDVTVSEGVDGSTVHINWSNIYGQVVHRGYNTLDAEYNWWGDENPSDDVVGDVDAKPCLPGPVQEVKSYMEEHDLKDPRAALVSMTLKDESSSGKATATAVASGVDPETAGKLVDKYGSIAVEEAMEDADTYEDLRQELEKWGN